MKRLYFLIVYYWFLCWNLTGHIYWGLFLKGKTFSFSILHMLLTDVGFSYMIFVTVRYIPSVLWFLSTELSGNYVNYVTTFFYLYQDDHTIFFLLVMLCITLLWLIYWYWIIFAFLESPSILISSWYNSFNVLFNLI